MRILGKDLKGKAFKISIDNLDDLWHLYNLIEEHDTVSSKTYRRIEKTDDKIRPEKAPKKLIWLAVEVKEVEFHEFSNRLRVHGMIVKGPDEIGLKSFHTLNFTINSIMELEKPEPWRKHQVEQLKTAVKATKQPQVTIVGIEDDNAVIAQMYQYGIRNLANIECSGMGKQFTGAKTRGGSGAGKGSVDSKKEFFNNILLQLKQVITENSPLIIVGPGFTKDDFFKFCKDKKLPNSENIILETTGQAGMVGIHEAVRRGIVKRLVQDSRITFETELVEKLLEGIAKDGPVVYGLSETEDAVMAKAVETLLIIDKLLRGKNIQMEQLLGSTEAIGGKVVIISTVHDAGKQLEALSGVAALLRFKI